VRVGRKAGRQLLRVEFFRVGDVLRLPDRVDGGVGIGPSVDPEDSEKQDGSRH